MTKNKSVQLWIPEENSQAVAKLKSPGDLLDKALLLNERDRNSIAKAFQAESYEMVSSYIWTKASATLKKHISQLGMDFVGEMLNRKDLDEKSDPYSSLSEHEALSLAEDLGMISTTGALRLKHAQELVNHFARNEAGNDEMYVEDAVGILRTCVSNILNQEQTEGVVKFKGFRENLSTHLYNANDDIILAIVDSPYFYIRTTLRLILSQLSLAKGAQLEKVVGNTQIIIPKIWPNLRLPERWEFGNSYSVHSAAGNRIAAAGLKKTLTLVNGFDYVPETLRSSTFREHARKLLEAHFALNNFYNEPEPAYALMVLGSTIPWPAMQDCMTAMLCVYLGNSYGICNAAQPHVKSLLDGLRDDQWAYYINTCLPADRTILDKLNYDAPLQRWFALVEKYGLDKKVTDNLGIVISNKAKSEDVKKRAAALRHKASKPEVSVSK